MLALTVHNSTFAQRKAAQSTRPTVIASEPLPHRSASRDYADFPSSRGKRGRAAQHEDGTAPTWTRAVRALRESGEMAAQLSSLPLAMTELGLPRMVASLSMDDAKHVTDTLVSEQRRGGTGTCTAWMAYVDFLHERRELPLPVTYAKVAPWILHRAVVHQSKTSGEMIKSSGLADTYAEFKRYIFAVDRRAWTIDEYDDSGVKTLMSVLRSALPSALTHTRELRLEELWALHNLLEAEGSPESRQTWAIITTAVGTQSRGKEWAAFRYADLNLDASLGPSGLPGVRGGVDVSIIRAKTGHESIEPQLRSAPHLPSQFGWLCAARALRKHLHADSKWTPAWRTDPTKRLLPVFSSMRHGSCTAIPLKVADVMARINAALSRMGLPKADAHFGRPSGATFYMHELHLAADEYKRMGSWSLKKKGEPDTVDLHYARYDAQRTSNFAALAINRVNGTRRLCCH